MLTHPQFDPVLFSLGPVAVRWYGLMYVVAFVAFVMLGKYRARKGSRNGVTEAGVDDMLLYGVLGVILGGRLGYVLFYKPEYYLGHPLEILQIWAGGMSFHGGFLGVLVAIWIFCARRKLALDHHDGFRGAAGARWGWPPGAWATSSTASCRGGPPTCPGACGSRRWTACRSRGTPRSSTSSPSRGSPSSRSCGGSPRSPGPRGPSRAPSSRATARFRFLAEFGRQPDDFLGLLAMGLSMGQWLSLPMIVAGAGLLMAWAYRRR